MNKKILKHVVEKCKLAAREHSLIEDKDRILLGVSGGKDSTLLVYLMHILKRTMPLNLTLAAVFIDQGWPVDIAGMSQFCRDKDIPFYSLPTSIKEIVFDIRREKNPCPLCANMRRGALNNFALELGFNKVALGHHLDDVLETFFLSLFYTGQFKTLAPHTYQDRSTITVIRPLVYLTLEEITSCCRELNLPVAKNPCPASSTSKRQAIRSLVEQLASTYPNLKQNFRHALSNLDQGLLWPPGGKPVE